MAKICKRMGLGVTNRYYEQISENVINIDGTTIMWDVPVPPPSQNTVGV